MRKTACEKFIDFPLEPGEEAWFARDGEKLSFKSNPYYLNLAREHRGIRRQVIPTEAELESSPSESADPLSEKEFSPLPRMVHRYANRIALLVTDNCAVHCRHCFRRSFTGKGSRDLSPRELEAVLAYVRAHEEIQEVLLTGGDPVTLPEEKLVRLLQAFRAVREGLLIRLGTRVPAVWPQRISEAFALELSRFSPLWVIVQFNHPAELTHESRRALGFLRKAGIPVVNQSVLLRGVNDDSDVLARLFQGLLAEGVKPYYLFQGDLARGTACFRVPLSRGWEIMEELRHKVSGLALPRYAVDLPEGGGKIPLSQSLLVRESETGYVFMNKGKEYVYPREVE